MSQGRQYFSQLEKSLLTELVAKHKDVLESKRNDFRTISQKNSLWETLSQEFNSQSGVTKRDAKQLKKCWENLKMRAKKVLAKEKRAAKLTGGGVSTSPADEQSSAIASIIPAQIDSLENPFDDDNYESETENGEVQSGTTSTVTPHQQPSTVVEAALSLPTTTKKPISAAQERCLSMQEQQHEAEMELLVIKKTQLITEHTRKLEVLDAELEYWNLMRKRVKPNEEEQQRPFTRGRMHKQ